MSTNVNKRNSPLYSRGDDGIGCCQDAFGSQVLRRIAIAKKSFCGPFPCIHPCLQDAMPTDPGCLATMQCQQRLQTSDQVCLAAGLMFQIFEVQQSMDINGTKNLKEINLQLIPHHLSVYFTNHVRVRVEPEP